MIELHADTASTAFGARARDYGPPLSEVDAERHIGAICFKTGPPERIGAELEWIVRDMTNPALPVSFDIINKILSGLEPPGVLPRGGLLTLEPGGQVELSTAPAACLSECVSAAQDDLAVLHEAFGSAGLRLVGAGLDQFRPPRRVLDLPRYAAMEEYFDQRGHWGRLMMCSTASVQVCVDAGLDDDGSCGYPFRWRLLHAIGPVLISAFANSPLRRGQPTGWKCTRQLIWSRLDPCRTHAPPGASSPGASPREDWVRYAMDAAVLCVRQPDGQPWTVPNGLSFRDWVRGTAGTEYQAPTADDLDYHLSTLFPPVRPRGHLELRMIDAQPGDGWIVPVALVAALADDPVAADAAMAAAEPVWHQPVPPRPRGPAQALQARPAPQLVSPWLRAARLGPADPVLARAAMQCFEAADAALARAGTPSRIRGHVAEFAERYVARGRCPADDILDHATISEG